MSKLLVVDDMALCREPIAEALRRRGHQVICATCGTEALDKVRDERPDLILLDLNMSEMDGLTTLKILRRNPSYREIPVLLLTDRSDRQSILDARDFGIQGYILKSAFSLDELFVRVENCLPPEEEAPAGSHPAAVAARRAGAAGTAVAEPSRTKAASSGKTGVSAGAAGIAVAEPARPNAAAPARTGAAPTAKAAPPPPRTAPAAHPASAAHPATPAHPAAAAHPPSAARPASASHPAPAAAKKPAPADQADLLARVCENLQLRPLGATVQIVMSATSSANCSAEDVAHAVANDQALSIQLLRIANTSAYNRGRPVSGIKAAVQRLGIQEVRKLVMALDVLDRQCSGVSSLIDEHLFWEHSLACGLIAAGLAKARGLRQTDDYFLWGVLHDVGRLILHELEPERYEEILQSALATGEPLERVEKRSLLADHCDVLDAALKHWGFSSEFIIPVIHHHSPVARLQRLAPPQRDAAATIALADRMAHALLLGDSGNESVLPLGDLVALLGIAPTALAQIAHAAPSETVDLKVSMLARADGPAWSDQTEKIKSRVGLPVRPVFAQASADVDACRLFIEALADPGSTEGPNLGVIIASGEASLMRAVEEIRAAEREQNAGALPLLLICDHADFTPQSGWAQDRKNHCLRPPVTVSQLVAVLVTLLSG